MSATERGTARATYDDLLRLPENVVGELIDGELHVAPRPSGRHGDAASVLAGFLVPPYRLGRGGPGGWWIVGEPEIHFVVDTVVLVPDIGGWRRATMPALPDDHRFQQTPDWICEVLSPSNARFDRQRKLPRYAQYGVAHLWLVDPIARTVETYRLENEHWLLLATYGGAEKFRAEPFEEIEIDLGAIWGEDEPPAQQ